MYIHAIVNCNSTPCRTHTLNSKLWFQVYGIAGQMLSAACAWLSPIIMLTRCALNSATTIDDIATALYNTTRISSTNSTVWILRRIPFVSTTNGRGFLRKCESAGMLSKAWIRFLQCFLGMHYQSRQTVQQIKLTSCGRTSTTEYNVFFSALVWNLIPPTNHPKDIVRPLT